MTLPFGCLEANLWVSGISQQEVAERAGVGHDYMARLVDVGVLAPAPTAYSAKETRDELGSTQGLQRAGLPTCGWCSGGYSPRRRLVDLVAAARRNAVGRVDRSFGRGSRTGAAQLDERFDLELVLPDLDVGACRARPTASRTTSRSSRGMPSCELIL
jgi:hypothetical protein